MKFTNKEVASYIKELRSLSICIIDLTVQMIKSGIKHLDNYNSAVTPYCDKLFYCLVKLYIGE